MSRQFEHFLCRAMAILEEECPGAFRELCAKLEGTTIRLAIGAELVYPAFDESGFCLAARVEDPEVELASDRETILAVVDGRIDLESAVWEERLRLTGSLDALARFHEGFIVCVGGAVRCPGFPRLLEQYRAAGGPTIGARR